MHKRSLDRLAITATVAVLSAAAAAACSPDSQTSSSGFSSGSAGGSSESGRGGSSGTDSGGGGPDGVQVSVGEGVGGGQNPGGELAINPGDPTLEVTYGAPGQTVQFTAMRGGQEVSGATWFLSSPEAGTISADGLFTSNGLAGGDITVGARLDDDTATTNLKIHLTIVENGGGVSQADIDTLANPNPGQTDAAWATWYPYDNTVFARGIPAPAWQFASSSLDATAYRLTVTGTNLLYDGYFLPTEAADIGFGGDGQQIRPSEAAWAAMGTGSDGGDLTVEVTKLVGGVKYGPIAQTIKIARGKLKGTIYYNSYGSPLAGDAAIMRIRGDLTTPEVLIGDCRVCHSVSADGSTVANSHEQPEALEGGIFDIGADPLIPPTNVWRSPGEEAAFAGLYPTGGVVWVQQGNPGNWQAGGGNTPGSEAQGPSVLRSRDGAIIPGSGIEAYYAQTPAFSHDGTMLAFYDRPVGGGTGVLAVMDFDIATNQFSNYRVLASPPPGRHYAWPAFTPDGQVVLFQDGNAGDLATWNGNQARLSAVSVSTGQIFALENLNGDAFVPQGVRDQNVNYEPTMLPLASGGYYWTMITSRRTFGNTLLGGVGSTKRLWVSAIDLEPGAGDISHPPFYVEGQEQAGNSRGFWALDPCRADGEGCESGDQCCNGFCNPSEDDPNVFECGQPDPGSCSDEFESCETAADCCDPDMKCINGRCAEDTPNVPN